MTAYVVLLRAVNVGGTGRLPMTELAAMCRDAGFGEVRTYIASGNVVLTSDRSAGEVAHAVEVRLQRYFGKPCGVFVRTAAELRSVLAANPFDDAPAKFTHVVFLDFVPAADALEQARSVTTERLALGHREIYIAYPEGQGVSKLKLPAAAGGTARNLNTVRKLTQLAAERE